MANAGVVNIALGLSGVPEVIGGLGLVNRALGTVGGGVASGVGGALTGAAEMALGFGRGLLTAGAAGAVALGGLGLAVGTTGVNFLAMKEQALVAFTTMLGSGEKAAAFLGKLQTFAAQTPFEFADVTRASQRLMAMGISADKVIPTLTSIGNAVAGLGGGPETVDRVTTAIGQMNAKGKTSAEEMMQLTEAGIPAWQYLAEAIGTDVPTAMARVTKGLVPASVAIAALTKGMDKDFGGMMAAQSRTFNGLKSSLSDYRKMMAAAAVQPLFTRVLLPSMTRLTDYLAGPGMTAAARFGAGLDTALTRATMAGRLFAASTQREITGRVLPAFQLLVGAFARVNTTMSRGGNLTALQRAEGVVYRLARGFQLGVDAVVTFKQALGGDWTNGGAGNDFVNTVGAIGLALGQAAAWVQDFAARAALVTDHYRTMATTLVAIVSGAVGQIQTALGGDFVGGGPFAEDSPLIVGALHLHDYLGLARTRADALAAALGKIPALPAIPAAAVAGAGVVGAAAVANPGLALTAGKAGIGAIGTIASTAGSVLGGLIGILGGPLTLALGAVALAVGGLYLAWTNNFMGIQDTVLPVIATLSGWFTGTLLPAVTNLATTIGTFLAPYVLQLGAALQAGIVNATPGVTAFFVGLSAFAAAAWPIIQQVATVISASLGPALNTLFTWATATLPVIGTFVGNVFLGIGTVLGWLAGVFTTHHETIIQIVTGAWAILSGIVQMGWSLVSGIVTVGLAVLTGDWQGAWNGLIGLVTGWQAGMLTALGGAWAAIQGLFTLQWEAIKTIFDPVYQWFYDIGTNIGEGIKAGITAAWESVKTLLGQLAGELPDPVKTALGIKSPSTVFADSVGAQIPAGIAAGITGNMGLVTSALNTIPTGTGGGLSGMARAAATTAGSLGGGRGGAGGQTVTVTVPVTINGPTTDEVVDRMVSVVASGVYDALAGLLGESGGGGGGMTTGSVY
jgi:tape measure domain-containing protein